MEVIPSSETSVHIECTRRCVLEDGNIRNYGCENIQSYGILYCFPYMKIISRNDFQNLVLSVTFGKKELFLNSM
jgi:hypothetical protein